MRSARENHVLKIIAATLLSVSLAVPAFAKHRAAQQLFGKVEVRHVFVVVLENADLAAAVQQPYLGYLARHGTLMTNYHGVAHPSQPNYIAMTAGDTLGVTSDDPVTVDATNLGDLLDAKSVSWRVYAENYPGDCFTGNQFGDPASGQYTRKHMPFISYADIATNPARCNAHIVNANTLDADVYTDKLPQVSFYIPNSYNDGHQTSVQFADAWLRSRFDGFLSDPRFIYATLFVVVFDESETKSPNLVYCSFFGAGVKEGATSTENVDHYSLLRTIEDLFHLGTLNRRDAAESPISSIWH